MFGAISEKFSTFDKQIYYCVTPQFLTFDDGWGGGKYLFSSQMIQNFHHTINQSIEKFLSIHRHSLSRNVYHVRCSQRLRMNALLANYYVSDFVLYSACETHLCQFHGYLRETLLRQFLQI